MSGGPLVVRFEVPTSPHDTHTFLIRDFFENHPRWDPGIIEVIPVDDGPVAPGRRGREVRRFLGTTVTEFEVVEADAHRLRVRDVPSTWSLERTWELEAVPGGGTRVTFTFDMQPRSPVFRIAYPAAKHLIARQVRQNMSRLERLLGSG